MKKIITGSLAVFLALFFFTVTHNPVTVEASDIIDVTGDVIDNEVPTGNIEDIDQNGILIIGDFVFDMGVNTEISGYSLNAYIAAMQTAFLNPETDEFEIYLRSGDQWYNLVQNDGLGLSIPVLVEDIGTINGDGTYQYWNNKAISQPAPTLETITGDSNSITITFDEQVYYQGELLSNISFTQSEKIAFLQQLLNDSDIDETTFNIDNIDITLMNTSVSITLNEDAIDRTLFYQLDQTGNKDGVYRRDITLDYSVFENAFGVQSIGNSDTFKMKFSVDFDNGVALYDDAIQMVFQTQAQRDLDTDPIYDVVNPTLTTVTPIDNTIEVLLGGSFVWTVQANDDNLYALELDHSFEGVLPEFSVYASETDPYGGDEAAFQSAGVTVDYDAAIQTWTIDFGNQITDTFINRGYVSFYIVLEDYAGNTFGSMNPTSPANTVTYDIDYITATNTTQNKGYSSIQAAIDDAAIDDEIIISEGTYVEDLFINTDGLTLSSISGNTLTSLHGLIEIQADNVTIDGFTVNDQRTGSGNPVIHMVDSNNVSIINNVVIANENAYAAIGTAVGPAKITGTISNNITTGMILVGTDGTLSVTNNTVTPTSATAEGVVFYPLGTTAELIVTGNTVNNSEGFADIKVMERPTSVNGFTTNQDIRDTLIAENTLANNDVSLHWVAFVTDEVQLKEALTKAHYEDIEIMNDIDVTSQLKVQNSVNIYGNGFTLTAIVDFGTENGEKHLMTIYGDDVYIEEITFDSGMTYQYTYGIQTYIAQNIVLENVSLLNSRGAGLTVNGSTVTAIDLYTSGNNWGAVNVDPGSGVSTNSVFTLTGNSSLTEDMQVWTDGTYVTETTTVTINLPEADGYKPHIFENGTVGYINHTAFEAMTFAIINRADANYIFTTIQAAIDSALPGETVLVGPGIYEENLVILQDGISLVSTMGADFTTIDAMGATNAIEIGEFTKDGIHPNDVAIDGFTVINWKERGIAQRNGDGTIYIYNNIVKEPDPTTTIIRGGIIVSGGNGSRIIGNTISLIVGVREDIEGAGIMLIGTDNAFVENNTVEYADIGISVGGYPDWSGVDPTWTHANNNIIRYNGIVRNTYGIGLSGNAHGTLIDGNMIAENNFGIYEYTDIGGTPTQNLINDNTIYMNVYGIVIDDALKDNTAYTYPLDIINNDFYYLGDKEFYSHVEAHLMDYTNTYNLDDLLMTNNFFNHTPFKYYENDLTAMVVKLPSILNGIQDIGYGDLQYAIDNAASGDIIEINEAITSTTAIIIDKDLIINGNDFAINAGFTIINDAVVTINNLIIENVDDRVANTSSATENIIVGVRTGHLTLNNIDIYDTRSLNKVNLVGVGVQSAATLTMYDSTVTLEDTDYSLVYGVYAQDGASTTLTNNTFDLTSTRRAVMFGTQFDVINPNLALTSNTQIDNINGDTYYFQVYSGSELDAPSVHDYIDGYLPEGKKAYVYNTTGYYGWYEYPVAQVDIYNQTKETHYSSLQDAIDHADQGNVIDIYEALTLPAQVDINKDITINGNGYEINAGISIGSGAVVTINDLIIDSVEDRVSDLSSGGENFIISVRDGDVTLNNVTITDTRNLEFVNLVGVGVQGVSTLTMNNSTVTLEDTYYSLVYGVYAQEGANVTLTGNTFNLTNTRRAIAFGTQFGEFNPNITLTNNTQIANANGDAYFIQIYGKAAFDGVALHDYVDGLLETGQTAYLYNPTGYYGYYEYPIVNFDIYNETQERLYESIQDALDDANINDTILVNDGVYEETLTITTDGVTLQSVNDEQTTEILGLIQINADNVTLDGFTVTDPRTTSGVPVIHIIDSYNVSIINNIVIANDNAYGAIGTQTGPAKVTGTINNNVTTGMIILGTDGVLAVTNNTITPNSATSEGIVFYPVNPTAELIITGNTINNSDGFADLKVNERPTSINGYTNDQAMYQSLKDSNTLANNDIEFTYAAFVTDEASLTNALTVTTYKDIYIMNDISTTSKLYVNRAVTINGNGYTITVTEDLGTLNSSKHALGLNTDGITVNDLTIDSNTNAYGLHAYDVEDIILNNVTLLNSVGAGLTINGSNVAATNLTTNGNAWGSVNVDPGSGVTSPSVFTLDEMSTLNEDNQIWSDQSNVTETATVSVNLPESYQHYIINNGANTWSTNGYWQTLPMAMITTTETIYLYADLQDAVNKVELNGTIELNGSLTLPAQVDINKDITINGNGYEINAGISIGSGAVVTINDLIIDSVEDRVSDLSSGGENFIISVRDGDVTLNNVTITDTRNLEFVNLVGVGVQGVSTLTMNNSTVTLEDTYYSLVYGVYAQEGANVTLTGNTFNLTNTRRAIAFGTQFGEFNPNITLTNNTQIANANGDAYFIQIYGKAAFDGVALHDYVDGLLETGQTAYLYNPTGYYGYYEYPIVNFDIYNETQERLYESIQDALEDANEDDTIIVNEGIYDGFEITTNGIELLALGDVTILANYTTTGWTPYTVAVLINGAQNVTIDGFTITSPENEDSYVGIAGFNSATATITNTIFKDMVRGILVNTNAPGSGEISTFTLTNNSFTNVLVGVGGTEDSILTAIDNTFEMQRVGAEGFGIGGGVTLPAGMNDLMINNTFILTDDNYALVDYRVSPFVKYGKTITLDSAFVFNQLIDATFIENVNFVGTVGNLNITRPINIHSDDGIASITIEFEEEAVMTFTGGGFINNHLTIDAPNLTLDNHIVVFGNINIIDVNQYNDYS